jgi:hypothetical protein
MRDRFLSSWARRPDDGNEQREQQDVAREHDPGHGGVELERVLPVVLGEPRLREHEDRSEEQSDAPPSNERDERDEPDEELR